MREYRSEYIRNIAVVGHGASGKTTLVDALAFVSGSSKRHGSLNATELFSMTHGHGSFVQRFKGYEQMPPDASQRVIGEQRGQHVVAE